jgi:hypothetical protein
VIVRARLLGLVGLAVLGSVAACGGGDGRVNDPYSAEDVQRAFRSEGIQLVARSVGPEDALWRVLLVPTDERFRVEIDVYADGKTAKNLSVAFDDFQPPGRGRRYDLARKANIVAVTERDSPETQRRVGSALRRLSPD